MLTGEFTRGVPILEEDVSQWSFLGRAGKRSGEEEGDVQILGEHYHNQPVPDDGPPEPRLVRPLDYSTGGVNRICRIQ